ncbi:MAG: hypothetical protein ABGY10_04175 [bacterium]
MLRNTLNTFITATFIMLLGVSSSAQAIVPMGDLMGSTSVTWGNDNQETTKPTALRVDLVPAKPAIEKITDELIDDVVTFTYTITSTANGPDKYRLGVTQGTQLVASDGGDVVGAALTTAIRDAEGGAITNPMSLGATAAIDSTDSTTITVICDAASSTASNCNGIEAGDTVIIGDGDTEYTVAEGGVSNTGEGPSTIRLNDVPVGILLGTRIAEQKTFKVVVSGDALLNPAEQVTFTLDVTGTSADGNQIGTASLAHTIDGDPIDPSVDRYARNLTDPAGNPEAANVESTLFDSGGGLGPVNYYKTGVSAKDTHEVEILIVLKAGNQGPQTDIVLNETLSPFVQYVPGSWRKFCDGGDGVEKGYYLFSTNLNVIALMGCEGVAPLNIANKSSAKVTYKVKVIGGDGDTIENIHWDVFGTAWSVVVAAGEEENPDLNACHCDSDNNFAGFNLTRPAYCPPTLIGWVVGENSYDSNDPDLQNTVRTLATDRVAGSRTYFELSMSRMVCK